MKHIISDSTFNNNSQRWSLIFEHQISNIIIMIHNFHIRVWFNLIESLYLNSTFQLCVILHFIAIGQQFQSSSRKSNYILVFHTAGTETTTSQGTVFKSLGHDFISVKTTSSYFSTQRRWIYLYDGCRKQKEKPTQVSKCIVTNQPPNNNLKWNSATLSVL